MPSDQTSPQPRAATPYLRFKDTGQPYLQGSRCGACGETFIGERENCASCTELGSMAPVELAETGTLYNYTIVYRSYPHITVPFISAIVALDGGGTLKGNLLDIAPSVEALHFDMPVKVVFRDAGIANPDAHGITAHFFTPATEQAAA